MSSTIPVIDGSALRLVRGIWSPVPADTELDEVARSALEAVRVVLAADFCAFVWRPDDGPAVRAHSQGISAARVAAETEGWLRAAGLRDAGPGDAGPGDPARNAGGTAGDELDGGGIPAATAVSPELRIEPVRDCNGRRRGALVAVLRANHAHSPDARLLMPVFAAHLGLLAERSTAQALRSASYEALVQIGMEMQAAEADVDRVLTMIVERARDLLGTDLAWLGLVDPADDSLQMSVAVGATTEPFMAMRLRLGEGVGGVAVASRRPIALPDYRRDVLPTPSAVRDAVLGEGIGSMLCAPMLHGTRAIGALYVGSRHPTAFSSTEVALACALAAQAAVAVENGRIYERLESKNAELERLFAVHRALTDAALRGSGPQDICAQLADLLAIELVLIQDVNPPFAVRCAPGVPAVAVDPPPACAPDVSFSIVADAELGELRVLGVTALTPLERKALEHGSTVLALELLKQRASQDVAWQLHGDLLGELLEASLPYAGGLVSRARRHGLDLDRPHRVVAVCPAGADPLTASGDALVGLVRRATGRNPHHRDAALVTLRGEYVVLVAREGDEDAACASLIYSIATAAEKAGSVLAIGLAEPGAEIPVGYRQAMACARLVRGDATVTRSLAAERLGALRFVLDVPDVSHVKRIVGAQLSPLAERASGDRAELFATLRAFVAADGNVARAADTCFVHKNTLRYRVQRAGEILGCDPFDADSKFELRIAFGLLDLFAGLGIDLLAAVA